MEAFTVTFCDAGENHAGMETLGSRAASGFSVTRLREFAAELEFKGVCTELVDLGGTNDSYPEAAVLVMRAGVRDITRGRERDMRAADQLLVELRSMPKDDKALMRGIVKTKRARTNNCIADFAQKPDYARGRGTVVNFIDYPRIDALRAAVIEAFQPGQPLVAELNHYYDVSKCGIGWHGDAERRLVVGVRVGTGSSAMPLKFQWFRQWSPVGEEVSIPLAHGDMYAMSDKAVGFDWKTNVKGLTLRHAAGAAQYSAPKKRKRSA